MAQSVNRVILVGRLGRDATVRYTADQTAVAELSVATDRHGAGEGDAETDWHRVVCWGRLAEFAGQHLTKGRLLCVIGRLRYRACEGRDGQTRRVAEVLATELTPLDRRAGAEPAAAADDEPPV